MDYRLDYVSKLLEKTSKKRIETYVISRIWHKLSNSEIKLVPQQYVKRNNEKYALTDLYLPQIKLHIEINEPPHYESIERIEIDEKRREEIENKTNHTVIIIDCRKSLDDIHIDIDEIINIINVKIIELNKLGHFKPWETDNEFTPEFHLNKGYLKIQEEPCLKTIEDICKLFDVKVPKRGFYRKGGIGHPTEKDLGIWWPVEKHRIWDNQISENGVLIYEKNKDLAERKKHVEKYINTKERRATFFCQTDVLGFKFYRFKGIFELDKELSNPEFGIVWKRIDDFIKL